MAAAVFEDGPLQVLVHCVRKCEAKGLPKPLVVATPTDANTYPVVVFLHGWNMCTWWYRCLLKHVASHGFIAVAPQLHEFLNFSISDADDIEATKAVTNWLLAANNKEQQQGLLHVLRDILKLEGVEPDLSRLALAGHSRGGDTAFAVALGLKGKHVRHPIPLDVNFSALVGVDPVGGVAVELGGWLHPLQWTVEPNVLSGPFDPRMPVLVIGTGRGPEGLVPCAPAGMNHTQFYELCRDDSQRYHFDVKDFGHVDMLDDDEPPFPLRWCPGNDDHAGRERCRKTMGGLMVAFLRDKLLEEAQDLQAVFDCPGLAPAILDQVQPQPA